MYLSFSVENNRRIKVQDSPNADGLLVVSIEYINGNKNTSVMIDLHCYLDCMPGCRQTDM